MSEDKSTRELVIRELPSQNGLVRVVLNPDEAVVGNDFVAAQCEHAGEVWRKDISTEKGSDRCRCLVCRLSEERAKSALLEQALELAGMVLMVSGDDVSKFRAIVAVDNPYLEKLLQECVTNGGAV